MPAREERFAELYRREHGDVLEFVARRAGVDRAEDLTHEAFLTVWRKLDDVPVQPQEARAWVFTVARNCVLNDQRAHARRGALSIRISEDAADAFVPSHADDVVGRVDIATAWGCLTPEEQEVISLSVWDDLTSAQAGRVLGISGPAFRVRLLRARASLRRALDPHFAARATRPAVQLVLED